MDHSTGATGNEDVLRLAVRLRISAASLAAEPGAAEAGARWSARSAARTNDLAAAEQAPDNHGQEDDTLDRR